ncbi:MAG: hypothetical protein H6838_09550 [Planctomycetes bacterium]|nr:hypothetical protein [Planctomycetota bacterium]MCB9885726.1 hypothetical protein [Planctomycetota bacterium]
MSFVPPFCPSNICPAHKKPEKRWFTREGYYQPKCRTVRVPRFRCNLCGRGFSRQTFRHDYRDHKPHTNAATYLHLVSGVGLRQTGRLVGLDVHSVQGKLRKMSRTCRRLHANLCVELRASEFLLDEEETYENSSIRTVTMPVVIERKTWFVVAATAGPIRRLAKAGTRRRRWQERDEKKRGRRPDTSRACVRKTLEDLRRRLPEGAKIQLHSDLKSSYATLARSVFGDAVMHLRTPGCAARTTANPLFPINTTLAMTRDNNGRLRRKSWLVSKKAERLVEQMQLFACYRNYVRTRFNSDAPGETPGRLLGLIERNLQAHEVLGWAQLWGRRSIHPTSAEGDRTHDMAAAG